MPQPSDTTHYSIAVSFSQAILDMVIAAKIPVPTEIRQQLLQFSAHQRLPLPIQNKLWLYLEQLDRPALGLKLGQQIQPESYGVVGFIMRNSSSLAEAAHYLVQYSPILGEGGVFKKHHQHQGWRLSYHAKFTEARELRLETIMACLATGVQWVTDGAVLPHIVAFEHAQRGAIADYRQAFGDAELRFNQPHTYLVYTDKQWQRARRPVNSVLQTELQHYADASLADLKPAQFSIEVRRVLTQQPTLQRQDVAALLALSERHLNRRLAAEGVSYRDVADDVRRQLAIAAVTHSDSPTKARYRELAQRFGYADGEAFAKAFKRWTGLRPRAYRLQRGQAEVKG